MKYLYESHLGGLYTSDKQLGFRDVYCETCGDVDIYIGSFETVCDFWNLIKDDCSIDGDGGWSLQYIYPFMIREFDLIEEMEFLRYYDGCACSCGNRDEEILERIKVICHEID